MFLLSVNGYQWIHGSRGNRGGDWHYLKPQDSRDMCLQVLDTDIQPQLDETGTLKPWDWCRDVMVFDPDAPWRGYIPSYHSSPYRPPSSAAPVWSWLFSNHALAKPNIETTPSGSFCINSSIVQDMRSVLPSLFSFASEFRLRSGWDGPPPPITPDLQHLGLQLTSRAQAQAHLWDYRRFILDVLGFIAYLFIHLYSCKGRDWTAASIFQSFPQIKDFLGNHLFGGQRFRGVIIDMEKFYMICRNDAKVRESIIRLIRVNPVAPIPLAILHNYEGMDRQYLAAFDFRSIPSTLGRIADMSTFVAMSTFEVVGYLPKSKPAMKRYLHDYQSVDYQSQIDTLNTRLIFLDKPRWGSEPAKLEPEEFEKDFHTGKISLNYLLAFDSGERDSLKIAERPSRRVRVEKPLPPHPQPAPLSDTFSMQSIHATPPLSSRKRKHGEMDSTTSRNSEEVQALSYTHSASLLHGRATPPEVVVVTTAAQKDQIDLAIASGLAKDQPTVPPNHSIAHLLRDKCTRTISLSDQFVRNNFGGNRSVVTIASIPLNAFNPDFLQRIMVRIPDHTEFVLMRYLQQFKDASGLELFAFCLSHGVTVFVSWKWEDGKHWGSDHLLHHGACEESHEALQPLTIAPRLLAYELCEQWIQRINRLCRLPESGALFFYGTYISRLLVEFGGSDLVEQSVTGPSHKFLAHGIRHLFKDTGEWDFRESEMRPDFGRIPMLQEIYGITEDGTRSLWPPLENFVESSQWIGVWSDQNESWFRERMEMLRAGVLVPENWSWISQSKPPKKLALKTAVQSWRVERCVGSPLERSHELFLL
jgi:hypothetical protein